MTFDLSTIDLPKWPQMLVTGVPVTPEQAKEIIRRTDVFFVHAYGGNNKNYINRIAVELGIPMRKASWSRPYENVQEIDTSKFFDEWTTTWGAISTNYVKNDWIGSSYIYGPYGWCHLDGTIGFVDNIGKWPSVSEVVEDWQTLLKEFPFLDVGVTIMDREHCEEFLEPLVSIVVKDGKVEVVSPRDVNVHTEHSPATRGNKYDSSPDPMGAQMEDSSTYYQRGKWQKGDANHENFVPDSWIKEWATRFKKDSK